MSQRAANLVLMRDLIEHLSSCQKQLEWSENAETIEVLTDSMLRDLERCQRLCEALRRRAARRPAV
jgi:hypothetical protein